MIIKNVKGSILSQSSLGMRRHFVKGSTMFYVAGGQGKGVSDIVIKIGRSLDDFAKRKIER